MFFLGVVEKVVVLCIEDVDFIFICFLGFEEMVVMLICIEKDGYFEFKEVEV